MGRHRRYETESFRLLFVCTGNICRSPFAEILTRHLLLGRLGGRLASGFDISSAGVRAVVGAPMFDLTRHELQPWGLDGPTAGRFIARQLRSDMIEKSHLVLGASTRHRAATVESAPSALSTAFTLREFARLAASVDPGDLPLDPVARAHALVDESRMQRGFLPPVPPADDAVPDPMGRGPEVHREAAELIRSAVQTIIDVIAPANRSSR